jgi:RNA polymerase-binding transcription factor DksA
MKKQKGRLIELRSMLLDSMDSVAEGNLRARPEGSEASAFGMHQADAGSDAYEKDFALSLLSQEQDALYEIEEALKRIEAGTYGVCEMSGQPIPVNRLEAIPFARFTVDCQSRFEKENKGRNRWESAQPFLDTAESCEDEGGEESEEEDKAKAKE